MQIGGLPGGGGRNFFFFACLLIFFFFSRSWVFSVACRLSLVLVSKGYSLVVVHRLLISVASLVAEHGL